MKLSKYQREVIERARRFYPERTCSMTDMEILIMRNAVAQPKPTPGRKRGRRPKAASVAVMTEAEFNQIIEAVKADTLNDMNDEEMEIDSVAADLARSLLCGPDGEALRAYLNKVGVESRYHADYIADSLV